MFVFFFSISGASNKIYEYILITKRITKRDCEMSSVQWTKLDAFALQRKTSTKLKRQPTEWENIYADNVTDNGLIPKRYILSIWKKKKTNQKMGRRLSRQFPKEDIQMANRYIERWATSRVPVVAQWFTNQTSIRDDAGLIAGFRIRCWGWQRQLWFDP